mmetsp:Transcript_24914/g.52013  ORF Transcript_24914/g.52013 Transcript_24914/m.52013 type:complete len:204 (-) Transcript_24914:155-766(-)
MVTILWTFSFRRHRFRLPRPKGPIPIPSLPPSRTNDTISKGPSILLLLPRWKTNWIFVRAIEQRDGICNIRVYQRERRRWRRMVGSGSGVGGDCCCERRLGGRKNKEGTKKETKEWETSSTEATPAFSPKPIVGELDAVGFGFDFGSMDDFDFGMGLVFPVAEGAVPRFVSPSAVVVALVAALIVVVVVVVVVADAVVEKTIR